MACKCGSENQKPFPADVKIYFDSGRSAAAPRPSSQRFSCASIVVFPNSVFQEDGMNCKHSEGQQQDDSATLNGVDVAV